MARLSLEDRIRIVTLHSKGLSVLEIRKRLQDENISISRQSVHNLIAKFRDHQIVADLPRRRKQPKITTPMKSLIEDALTRNDEITSRGLRDLLLAQWPDLQVSFPTIKRVRKEMGWVCTRPHYCQLLRPVSSIVLLMSMFDTCCTCISIYCHLVSGKL